MSGEAGGDKDGLDPHPKLGFLSKLSCAVVCPHGWGCLGQQSISWWSKPGSDIIYCVLCGVWGLCSETVTLCTVFSSAPSSSLLSPSPVQSFWNPPSLYSVLCKVSAVFLYLLLSRDQGACCLLQITTINKHIYYTATLCYPQLADILFKIILQFRGFFCLEDWSSSAPHSSSNTSLGSLYFELHRPASDFLLTWMRTGYVCTDPHCEHLWHHTIGKILLQSPKTPAFHIVEC